jgi:GMP synthase-like glutamine amidotransferase
MRLLSIQNCEIEGFGLYERHLRHRGIAYNVIHAYRDEPLPPIETVDGLLIGGTPISAYAAEGHPFLRREMAYLEQAIAAGIPCFGICCGAQMLAQILGAQVHRCARMEIGSYRVRLTDTGQGDPLLQGFPEQFPVFHWHGDTFEIPEGGTLLVEGIACRHQLFRHGAVLGVQFHLETTPGQMELWTEAYADELAALGKSKAQLMQEYREHESEMAALAARLMDNWIAGILPAS